MHFELHASAIPRAIHETTIALLESWKFVFCPQAFALQLLLPPCKALSGNWSGDVCIRMAFLGLMCIGVLNALTKMEPHPSYGAPQKLVQGSLYFMERELTRMLTQGIASTPPNHTMPTLFLNLCGGDKHLNMLRCSRWWCFSSVLGLGKRKCVFGTCRFGSRRAVALLGSRAKCVNSSGNEDAPIRIWLFCMCVACLGGLWFWGSTADHEHQASTQLLQSLEKQIWV